MSFRIVQSTLPGLFYIEKDGEFRGLDLTGLVDTFTMHQQPDIDMGLETGQYKVIAEG